MSWFTKMCRQAGLMVHRATTPPDQRRDGQTITEQRSKQVEETKVNDQVTVRRTTIEEVEYRPSEKKDSQTNR